MAIRFTPSARDEFLAAVDCIRKDKPGAAGQSRRKAERALRRLNKSPDSGRRLPEFPDLPFREVIVAPYRFFYRKERKTVWSLRCGTERNSPTSLKSAFVRPGCWPDGDTQMDTDSSVAKAASATEQR